MARGDSGFHVREDVDVRETVAAGATGASLIFAPGARPSARDVEALLESGEAGAPAARVSHRPPGDEGWLEILSSGLTFDIAGLYPADPARGAELRHVYGFEALPRFEDLQAVGLVPGGHVAGGGAMLPVVRTLAGLAAGLALQLPVAAVAWHGSGAVMAPGYFARIVMNWLGGGAFPVPGLAALTVAEDGSVASEGLATFCGQEFRLEAARGEGGAETYKLAMRIADHIVRRGPLLEPGKIEGAPGLFAEPSHFGKRVWIWRQE